MASKILLVSGVLMAAGVCGTQIPVASLADGASCACTQLAAQYPSIVLTSNSTNYTTEITDFWDVRSDLEPACVFLPTEADQVADAVSTFTSCGAQFAIRGGGHMNFPGANNINGGVLLALGGLNTVEVASDNQTVSAGPGNRLYEVYGALAPYGLYCIGGRMKTIGVSGLSLIGGFHYFNNKYGMAMDNLVSYDVVLGNGTQVVANATSNPDLFWGLKGGSNNLGIVTKYTLKTYAIPLVSTTIQTFNGSEVEDFLAATVNLALNDGPDIGAGSIISITYNVTTGEIAPSLLGVQEGTESPPSRFANFSAIPSTYTSNNVMTPIEWHDQLDSPFQMFRVQFAHHTMKPDATQLYSMFLSWKAAVDTISDVEGLYPTFVVNFLPASALSVAKNNGIGNVWGFDDDQSYILWQLSTGWANAEDDLRMTNWARSFSDYWHQDNLDKGLGSDFIYMGDAGEFQDPFPGFPAENVQRLLEVRDAYDPLGVFSRLNWGGFKLPVTY
ncbi:hypothetical protein BX600DRAFT_435563 [Xylariales sp. PMI_506]|nr:hypothetical protein BX600DRAFT_435563 [Xylariales sp. PMI_506]